MRKYLNYASYATLLLTFGLIVTFAYMAFYPFNVIDVEPQPYVLKDTNIQSGGVIAYEFHYCKNYDVQARIIHQVEGTQGGVAIPYVSPNLDSSTLRLKDRCGTTTKMVHVPEFVPEGRYVMCEYVDYDVNFLQTVKYTFCTEPFTVTK